MLSVHRAVEAPDAFVSWRARAEFSAVDRHPIWGEFGRLYYPAVYKEARRDESFAVVEQGEPLLLVLCTLGSEHLDYFGSPIKLFLRPGLAAQEATLSVLAAFAHLDEMIARNGVRHVVIVDEDSVGTLSPVGKQCLNRNFNAAVRLTAVGDLTVGEQERKRQLRKSFRSLVNWGRRNLTIAFVNVGNADRELFERYRELHYRVAGRTTRSLESWGVMFEWITSGAGELLIGSLADGSIVTGTMIVDGASIAYYASGAYDRDRLDLPLTHWPLWLAMLRSAERGLRIFDIGVLPPEGSATKKEVAIGYFKRGFATAITTGIAWNLDLERGDAAP